MNRACVLLFCITQALCPLLAWCTVWDERTNRYIYSSGWEWGKQPKWGPDIQLYLNELKKEVVDHFKKNPSGTAFIFASPPDTEYPSFLQAEIENIIVDAGRNAVMNDYLKESSYLHEEKKFVNTSTASPQTDDTKKVSSTRSPDRSVYTKDWRMGYTEGSVSRENKTPKEISTPATPTEPDTKPDTKPEYLELVDEIFDAWDKFEKSEAKKGTTYTTTERTVSTKSQATKEYTTTEESASRGNQTPKEISTPATPTEPDTKPEYLKLVDEIFDALDKFEKSETKKGTTYTTTERTVSTKSQATKEHTTPEESASTGSQATKEYTTTEESVSTGSQATKEYTTTEESVSTGRQATKEYTTPATSTEPGTQSKYLKSLTTVFNAWKNIGKADTVYATTEGIVSTGSQTTKAIHSTSDFTKGVSTERGQAAHSHQDDYTTRVHQVSITQDYPRFGSLKGRPGLDFPNYTDIPLTSFNCFDKDYLPGFYADLESRCQVFHACWPNRRESFLCPLGTTFNQALMACDYWYSTNCSLAPHYYNVNAETSQANKTEGKSKTLSSMINILLQKGGADFQSTTEGSSKVAPVTPETVVSFVSQFLPVKAKVVVYPESSGKRAKIVASASVGEHTVRKFQEGKTRPQSKVVKERLSTTESSDVPHSTEHSTSTILTKKAAEEEAVQLFIKKLRITMKNVWQDINDILDRNYTTKPRRPVSKESNHTVPPELREFDEAVQTFLDTVADGITRSFYEKSKRLELKEPGSFETAAFKNHNLTRLNPRFVIKPVGFPKEEVKTAKSEPHPIESSIKISRRPVPEKPKYKVYPPFLGFDNETIEKVANGLTRFFAEVLVRTIMNADSDETETVENHTLNPSFVIKPVDIPKEVKPTKSVPHPAESSFKSSRRPVPVKPRYKYTSLNPRFIIKPVYIPKQEVMTTTKLKTILQSRQNSGPGISPSTKKALARNYVRFLRRKSG